MLQPAGTKALARAAGARAAVVTCSFVSVFMGVKASREQEAAALSVSVSASKEWMDRTLWKTPNSSKSSVRAPHQLEFSSKPGFCDYCRIASSKKVKTKYTCKVCNLNFCFTKERNHFKIWHSEKCDHYRGYT